MKGDVGEKGCVVKGECVVDTRLEPEADTPHRTQRQTTPVCQEQTLMLKGRTRAFPFCLSDEMIIVTKIVRF